MGAQFDYLRTGYTSTKPVIDIGFYKEGLV